jgi:hypothetical protein
MRTVGEILKSEKTGDFGVLHLYVATDEHWTVGNGALGGETVCTVYRPKPAALRQLARAAEKLAGLIEELAVEPTTDASATAV